MSHTIQELEAGVKSMVTLAGNSLMRMHAMVDEVYRTQQTLSTLEQRHQSLVAEIRALPDDKPENRVIKAALDKVLAESNLYRVQCDELIAAIQPLLGRKGPPPAVPNLRQAIVAQDKRG